MSADQGRAADESACTPGSVPGRLAASRWAVIHLGLPLPAGSSGPPAGIGRAALERLRRTAADADPAAVPLDLAPGGVYRATPVTRCAVVSYTAVSPLPARALAVCSLWHCPAGHPGSLLATTLPCGARTFLGDGVSPADATAQPTRPSCRPVYWRSSPVEPEAHAAGSVLGQCRHVDLLSCLLVDRDVGQPLQVPAVLAQRRDRRLDTRADVHDVRRIAHLLDGDVLHARPRLLGQLREDPLVRGIRDRVEHALPQRPVVGRVHVRRGHPGWRPGGAEIPRDDEVRPVPPDGSGEIPPQPRAVLQKAVPLVEELHLADPDDGGRRPLLRLAQRAGL